MANQKNWLKTVKNLKWIVDAEIWTVIEMTGIAQNEQKCLIFFVVPLQRIENI